jgi:hypothetical protein
MSELILDSTTRVRRSYYVRKRKSGGSTFLICLTALFEIDGFTETFWDECREPKRLHELTTALVAKYPELEPMRVVELVAHNIAVLSSSQFLEVNG